MDGYDFENYCARRLKKKHFRRVEVTKRAGDKGVDIIAKKHGKKYGVRCKYYSTPVGIKAVREAHSGANYFDCDRAVVMTNSVFTSRAKDMAQKLDVILYERIKKRITFKSVLFFFLRLFVLFLAYTVFLFSLCSFNYAQNQNRWSDAFEKIGDFEALEQKHCVAPSLESINKRLLKNDNVSNVEKCDSECENALYCEKILIEKTDEKEIFAYNLFEFNDDYSSKIEVFSSEAEARQLSARLSIFPRAKGLFLQIGTLVIRTSPKLDIKTQIKIQKEIAASLLGVSENSITPTNEKNENEMLFLNDLSQMTFLTLTIVFSLADITRKRNAHLL